MSRGPPGSTVFEPVGDWELRPKSLASTASSPSDNVWITPSFVVAHFYVWVKLPLSDKPTTLRSRTTRMRKPSLLHKAFSDARRLLPSHPRFPAQVSASLPKRPSTQEPKPCARMDGLPRFRV